MLLVQLKILYITVKVKQASVENRNRGRHLRYDVKDQNLTLGKCVPPPGLQYLPV